MTEVLTELNRHRWVCDNGGVLTMLPVLERSVRQQAEEETENLPIL
jgi:hypothetical protein